MKYKASTTLVLMMMILATACTQKLQPGWQLDVQKSQVLWNTGKMMGGHFGYFLFQSGNLEYSTKGEPQRGTFRMDMNSLHTTDNPTEAGKRKKDAELMGNEFFSSGEYPLATMVVKKITRIGASMDYDVAGDLTIKDITNPIEFKATIITNGKTSHITANVDISHQQWGLDPKSHKKGAHDVLSDVKQKIVADIHVSLDIIMNK